MLVQDVTELRERAAFVESIFDGAGEGLVVYDRDMRCVAWNRAMEERTGIAAAKVIGRLPSDVLLPGLAHNLEGHLRAVLDTGERRSVEAPYAFRDMVVQGWALSTYSPQRDHLGRIVGVIESVRDHTQRRLAEDALRLSEGRYRAIVEQAPVAVGVHRGGLTLEVNNAYRRLFRLPPDADLAGKSLGQRVVPERRAEVEAIARKRAANEATPVEYDTIGLREDGTTFPMHAAVVAVELSNGPATLVMLWDLTDRGVTAPV